MLAAICAAIAFVAIAADAAAADIRVMISAGFFHAYSELVPAFERESGHRVITTRGPSMGDSPEAIPARLARGGSADVAILDGGAADALAKAQLAQGDTKVELARSLVGMVVRAGAPKPDIGSVDAFKQTLRCSQDSRSRACSRRRRRKPMRRGRCCGFLRPLSPLPRSPRQG
jgi:molybdate transport system substrate-binding protein